MSRPVNSSISVAYKSESGEALTPEEIEQERRALEDEQEQRAQEELDAEEEELGSPLDPYDEEGWEDDIQKMNE